METAKTVKHFNFFSMAKFDSVTITFLGHRTGIQNHYSIHLLLQRKYATRQAHTHTKQSKHEAQLNVLHYPNN